MYSIFAKEYFLYIICKMYVTLRLGDNMCFRIHSVSDDGNGWIVTDKGMWLCPGRWLPDMVQT